MPNQCYITQLVCFGVYCDFYIVFCITYSVVNCLNVSFGGLIASIGDSERADFSLGSRSLVSFPFRGIPLPLSNWDRLCHLIVALALPSI